jgi:hypothetical protein
MVDTTDDDFSLTPPDAQRVAARAIVLSAVSCRALIEKDADVQEAEELRHRVVGWLDSIGAAEEMEPAEVTLLSTPLGKLDRKRTVNATWQSEGMVVLAWALRCADLPPVHIECEPNDVADAMGFLDDRQNTLMHAPRLRGWGEIETWADTYLTLHWRLRQFSLEPAPMDFVAYVAACTWGPLRLDKLETLDDDLAIDGVCIDQLEHATFRRTLSITQERHQAFNWLLGFEPLYSDVTTDT